VNRNIIVIGASAGGVEAVPRLLGSLPANIPASFFVTLHVPAFNESLMPMLISRSGALPAEHPRNGTPIRPGRVYVAPPDYHLILGEDVVHLGHGPKENRHRPAIDPLFRSAARVYGERVAGVLLTGYLDDGVAGLRDIQQHNGLAIVQDPKDAAYPEMPRNALRGLHPDHCLPLKQIESLLARLPSSNFGGAKMKAKKLASAPSQSPQTIAVEPKAGRPVGFVCPECQGPLWEFDDGKLVRFQCLVGHRYSLESLLDAHADELESALWVALRGIEERINLQRHLAEQSKASGRTHSHRLFEANVFENQKHARVLRQLLEKFGRAMGTRVEADRFTKRRRSKKR
jgi:two-component system chemotaxis response regulator CheB